MGEMGTIAPTLPQRVFTTIFFSFLSLSPEISIFVHSLAHLSRLFVSARTVRNTFSSVQFSTLHLFAGFRSPREHYTEKRACLLYTSDAADE